MAADPPPTTAALRLLSFAVPLALFGILAVAAATGERFSWDGRLLRFLNEYEDRSAFADVEKAADFLVEVGADALALLLVAVVVLSLVLRRRFREAALPILTPLGVLLLVPTIKHGLRDDDFPSGHAARSMAVVAALALLAWRTRWRWPANLLGAAFVLVLGASLVFEGWHAPSEVLAGWCLSLAWLAALRLTLFRGVPP